MRARFFLFFWLLVATSCKENSKVLVGDSWSQVRASKKGTLVVTYTDAPKFSLKEAGKNKGICFDILEDFKIYLEAKYGIDLKIRIIDLSDPYDFSLLLDTVSKAQGGLIGASDITITEERRKFLKFSNPYFYNVAILTTQNDIQNLSELKNIGKEFAGMKAIAHEGTTNEERLRKIKSDYYPDLIIEASKGLAEANEKVLSDSSYFTYLDAAAFFELVEKNLPLKRHPAGDQKGESFGFIMSKNSDWDIIFNEFLSANNGYTNSRSYRKILSEHLGKQVLNETDSMNQ
jgi:putative glutamine transport system substrate-binding protein